jgi:hypothetical protein
LFRWDLHEGDVVVCAAENFCPSIFSQVQSIGKDQLQQLVEEKSHHLRPTMIITKMVFYMYTIVIAVRRSRGFNDDYKLLYIYVVVSTHKMVPI